MQSDSRIFCRPQLPAARIPRLLLISVAALLLLPVFGAGQEQPADSYTLPPQPVSDYINRDKNFATLDHMSPDGDHFFVTSTTELSSLKLMSQKIYRLAMLKITPATNRELDHSTYGMYAIRIFSLADHSMKEVKLPQDTWVSDLVWSRDGKKLAFFAHLPAGSQVWVADAATAEAAPIGESYVMATLAARAPRRGNTAPSQMLQWTPDGSIITLLVPSGRGPEPEENPVPSSPLIRRTRDKSTPTPTLPFLLRTPHDRELFRYYTTAQIALLAPGKPARTIGEPAMFLSFSLSPDGKYLLADRIVEPLSYLVGYTSFGHRVEVMELATGKTLATVSTVPLREASERGGSGNDLPREIAWRPDGKGLGYLQLEEKKTEKGEDASEAGERNDRVMLLAPPFDSAITVLSSTDRISDAVYSSEGNWLFATLAKRNGGNGRRNIVAWNLEGQEPQRFDLIKDFDPEDPLALPGSIMTRTTGNGIVSAFLSSDQQAAFLEGPGYKSDFKPRPFIDRVTIRSAQRQRVFEGSAEVYEKPLRPLDSDMTRLVISRESKTMFPDSYLWTKDGATENLTHNRDPYPDITACKRIDFSFERSDGVTVQARISLPEGYREGTRVPAVFWDYPREYGSSREYGNDAIRSRNQNAHTQLSFLRWSDLWLTQGYALVYTDIPIIGKGDSYNDFYLTHMIDSIYGAIRKLDQMGLIDVDRIGHGGHSYGAFATANLLAHSPFFKAGIAGDGAYNRSLTPMTFQRERRFIWTAQTTYLEMSPFFYADQISAPMLMYHGGQDDNSGTYLIQSERMMQALTGLGKKAILYVYPFEAHSPRCKETYMDIWARWLSWFSQYVKNPSAVKDKTEERRN